MSNALIERQLSKVVTNRAAARLRAFRRDAEHASECGAWTTAAAHAVRLVCPSPHNTYHQAAVKFETTHRDYEINDRVGEFTGLLKRLLADVDDGLLTSVANQTRGETLDDLLDRRSSVLIGGRDDPRGRRRGVRDGRRQVDWEQLV